MYSSEEEYDSNQGSIYSSDEEHMEFLDQHERAGPGFKARSSVWGVIDKSVLAQVQVK